jgi:hypothetical protein
MNHQFSSHLLVPECHPPLPIAASGARSVPDAARAGGSFPVRLEFSPGQITQGIGDLALKARLCRWAAEAPRL